jgi:Fe-Mn family superoxide dismutase
MAAMAALGAGALTLPRSAARAQQPSGATAASTGSKAGRHAPLPLPFDPAKLPGLSERLLVSHHDNNYAGALRNLDKVQEQLAGITQDTPGFLVAGLKERELTFTNSVILHELYFANLGGDGKPAGGVKDALGSALGGPGRWEELMRATALSLAGGSGWALLDFNFHTGEPRVYGSGSHAQSLAFGSPLLVLDMYEHAYHMDYGAQAARYVDAFFANVRWDEVDRRHARALRAWSALRS